MGVTRFLLTSPDLLAPDAAQRVYFTGLDGVPLATTATLGSVLEVRREGSDSGNYHIPWPTRELGELMLSTASLPQRDQPYRLAVELARGTLSQLRNQAGDWQEIGLIAPEDFAAGMRRLMQRFGQLVAVAGDLADSETRAAEVIELALAQGEMLAAAFVEQALNVRKRQSAQLPTLLGAALEQAVLGSAHARLFLASFNSAAIALNWRHVEPVEGVYQWQLYDQQTAWCRQQDLAVVAGPLLKLDATGCPDWLCLWEGDFENLVQLVNDYVETAVHRFRGKVDLWNCAARFASGQALSLSEDECLRLAARAVELVRHADPDTPAILTFDQPWAEYLRAGQHQLSPLHVADALLRSDLGLAGIGLELNLGYHPAGSGLRSLLAVNRLLDWWSAFGLPLYLFLTLPSSSMPDPNARIETRPSDPQTWSGQRQAAWAQRIVSLSIAKPTIRGVFWNQWRDDQPHDFPHGGLFDAEGKEKPVLARLRRLRRRNLT
jgi:hypothetical protein